MVVKHSITSNPENSSLHIYRHIFVCPKYINFRNILLHDLRRTIHEDAYELDIVNILTDNIILKLTANYIISVNERR